MNKTYAYVSRWNNLGGAPGIGVYEYDVETSSMKLLSIVREDLSCGVSFIDRDKDLLYVCVEAEDHPNYYKGGGGRVIAFKIDPKTGGLTEFSALDTYCPNPSGFDFDKDGKYMVLANHSAYNACTKIIQNSEGEFVCEIVYDDAVVEAIRIEENGSFGKITDISRHEKLVKGRAMHSHPQSVSFSLDKTFILSTETGENCIYTYYLDGDSGKLSIKSVYEAEESSKPRCCVFHPSLPIVYVNYEGKKELDAYDYSKEGILHLRGSASGIPEGIDYPHGKGQSGLLIHPSGRYLYSLMTATASIAVFEINEAGMPKLLQLLPTKEKKLRAIGLSHDANYLLTTCIQTGSIDFYRILGNGMLEPTDSHSELTGAAFVSFYAT